MSNVKSSFRKPKEMNSSVSAGPGYDLIGSDWQRWAKSFESNSARGTLQASCIEDDFEAKKYLLQKSSIFNNK